MNDTDKTRNFAIIAHIDHGKSTLADRIIEICNAVEDRQMRAQLLDSMDIERERGITIKAQTVRLHYKGYILNLIDTPGHVDFAYEVNRSLSACEGSLLIVDSTQGVEAQTLANAYHAVDNNHEIVIALNKSDLPASNMEATQKQIEDVIGLDASKALPVSAKTGAGVTDVLDALIEKIPHPKGDNKNPLQALIVDSWYDSYLGVIILVCIKNGILKNKTEIKTMSNNRVYNVGRVGIFTPKKQYKDTLEAGEIGFITTNIKVLSECKVGDTITSLTDSAQEALPGFSPPQSAVFCGIFPIDADDFESLRDKMEKLRLNDSSFEYTPQTSTALGNGFRCGFLGLLHLEIIMERLEREYGLNIITTAPGVVYKIHLNDGKMHYIDNPAELPDNTKIDYFEEPIIKATIITPDQYIGPIINLCIERRGAQTSLNCSGNRAVMEYKLPLSDVIFDLYDRIKSVSSGYASFNWIFAEYTQADVVKLSIMVNGEQVDALSCLIHKSKAESRGREICNKLKDLIPRQMFKIALQAAIGGKIIARETISAIRKDVTAKCYGGDVTRKKKLLEKQKKGKKKMMAIGNVEIPNSAFIAALKVDKT